MKGYTTGLELEQFLIDSTGNINFGAERILKILKKKYPNHHYQKEVGTNMLEFGSNPSTQITETLASMAGELNDAIAILKEHGLKLYPFATYPGEYRPNIRTNPWYEVKKRILGEYKIKMSGQCIGFHFHFSLPKKSFEDKSKFIKVSKNDLENKKMVSSYNLLIAADPVLTTFTQSSPYIQGKFLAKDSRMLYYRGGSNLNYHGLYHKFQLFGGLQNYITTIHDIIEDVEIRYVLWQNAVLAQGFDVDLVRRYGRRLDYAWNPVKVNKHGTFEQRGMDANLPTYVAATALIVQKMLQRVYDEQLTIAPSKDGTKEPFKIENGKLFVPPSEIVLKEYQYLSAVEGLENKRMQKYCRALYRFILPEVKGKKKKLLNRIRQMLSTKKTIADRLIDEVKKEGLWNKRKLPPRDAARLANKWSGYFENDLRVLEKWL